LAGARTALAASRAAGHPITFYPPLPKSVYVGLAVTAHNAGEVSEAKFRDL